MSMTILYNCRVTRADSEVLQFWVGDKDNDEFKRTHRYHTGVDIAGTDAYSIVPGKVIQVSKENNTYCVTVQYESNSCVRYKNLQCVEVDINQTVEVGTLLGKAIRSIHVELLRSIQSMWPVRIGGRTYYKHDPYELIVQGYQDTTEYFISSEQLGELKDTELAELDPELLKQYPWMTPLMFYDEHSSRGGAS